LPDPRTASLHGPISLGTWALRMLVKEAALPDEVLREG
jgi:hypothetical protein